MEMENSHGTYYTIIDENIKIIVDISTFSTKMN